MEGIPVAHWPIHAVMEKVTATETLTVKAFLSVASTTAVGMILDLIPRMIAAIIPSQVSNIISLSKIVRERNIYFKHVFAESIQVAETCNGGNSCCSPSKQCVDGEGDCDNDNDCEGNLVCGVDNCDRANPAFDSTDDCCFSLILGTDKQIFFHQNL